MPKGKIASIAKQKGFGFIAPEGGGADIFFHITVTTDFLELNQGDVVSFELQPEADKPRAAKVEPIGGGKGGRHTPSTGRGSDRKPPPLPRQPIEMGFVTKLRKNQQLGFISPDKGGQELLFGAEHVSGSKKFAQLSEGDSVRFCREVSDEEVPTAINVHFWKRDRTQPGPELPENKKARRRKPTWRR